MSTALSIPPIDPDEVDHFLSFADASPLGLKPPREMYLEGLGRWYRPEWSWVALRDGGVVARVAFSGQPAEQRGRGGFCARRRVAGAADAVAAGG